MKNLLVLLSFFLLTFNASIAASITEELTQLNNLFKEGAITKEEFSKAKSILLKTETTTKKIEEKKKSKKIVKKKKKKANIKEKIVKKNINEDLTKSYIHIDEIHELGNFEMITEAPEGMFKTKSKHFSPKVKEASENMYSVFVQKKGLMEKYPENLMKAMGHFEFFYMEQLRKKQKNITRFREKWPNIPNSVKKDVKSLYSLNQARKTMRESMGLTLNDDVQDALQRYMLMHDFLSQAKKETVKLNNREKKLRKNSKKLNSSISSIEKNTKLRIDQRIKEKEFQKNISKDIKTAKLALRMLTKDGDNVKFYKTINKTFIDIIENNSDLNLLLDGTGFISGLIKDVEKNLIPKKHIQNMDGISVEDMPEKNQKILASVSMSMKIQKNQKKDLLHNSMLNLSNHGLILMNTLMRFKTTVLK